MNFWPACHWCRGLADSATALHLDDDLVKCEECARGHRTTCAGCGDLVPTADALPLGSDAARYCRSCHFSWRDRLG